MLRQTIAAASATAMLVSSQVPISTLLTMSPGVCVLGEKLFAVGGYDGSGYLSLVEAYDSRENVWKEVKSNYME